MAAPYWRHRTRAASDPGSPCRPAHISDAPEPDATMDGPGCAGLLTCIYVPNHIRTSIVWQSAALNTTIKTGATAVPTDGVNETAVCTARGRQLGRPIWSSGRRGGLLGQFMIQCMAPLFLASVLCTMYAHIGR